MREPQAIVTLAEDRQIYRPGEVLTAEYRLEGMTADDVAALEVSVLWYTQGKGGEDMAVHFFKRFAAAEGDYIDSLRACRISTLLPQSPLSYEGVIVKIRWCVRVRVFLRRGKELVQECPFQLGNVPSARAVLP